MKATHSPELRNFAIGQIRAIIEGRRDMPAVHYESRNNCHEIHRSDLDNLCPMKPLYFKTLDEIPPVSDTSTLQFWRGRMCERSIFDGELEPVVKDDITCTIDGHWAEGNLICEVKSTAKDLDSFNPETTFPWWIGRCKDYCFVHGVWEIGLIVTFMVGNAWTFRARKNPFIPIDLNAWILTFANGELRQQWEKTLERKERLRDALNGNPFPKEYVTNIRQSWECNRCQFSMLCPYFST